MKIALTKTIKVGVIYNAFDPSQMQREELVYRKNTKLKSYLFDLPTDCDWLIGLNGNPVTLEEHGDLRLKPDDNIQLVVVPHGKSGVKSVLRMVALVAVAVGAAFLFAPGMAAMGGLMLAGQGFAGIAAMTAFSLAGSLLINAVLPPAAPKQDKEDSQSYGYDGAKNTAKQGVAMPVVYGQYRVAGNYVDLYSENVGDDQYLYGRTILSDGKITSVALPLLNDQPIDTYTAVDWGFRLGEREEAVNPWFNRNTVQVNKNVVLTNAWTTHTTTSPVDQLQVNIQFPRGLVHINDKGKKKNRTAGIEIQYTEKGANNWRYLGTSYQQDTAGDIGAGRTPQTTKLAVTVQPTLSATNVPVPYSFNIEYRLAGTSAWTTFKTVNGQSNNLTYIANNDNWAEVNDGSVTYSYQANAASYEWPVPTGSYEMRITGQGTMSSWGYIVNQQQGNAIRQFTDNRAKPIRKTIDSGKLDLGNYDIRMRFAGVMSDDENDVDEMYLTDIGEITNTGITMSNIANAYYRIKMTEQLNGVPKITWLVKGVEVQQYDMLGNKTTKGWSDNPAWIILDMLIGEDRGRPDLYTIDYPMFVEWAAHCEANSLKFNGTFDSMTTLWDACVDVLKVGHASFSRIGTKLSLTIDRPQEPVMLFGPGNIFKDTFNISYIGMSDRANEFEVSYFDRDNNNEQKTIRVIDPDADNRGDSPRPVSYSLFGVDNFEQAQKEAWYQLYNNRYVRRTIMFEAPIESIGLTLGDVALIQHDMMNWGTSGRTGNGSTVSTVKLDKKVLMETGSVYSLLVIHDKLVRSTGTFASANGNVAYITGASAVNAIAKAKRMYQPANGADREILNVNVVGADSAYVTFDGMNGFVVGDVQFIDTDVVEERDVTFNAAETTSVSVTTPFTNAPAEFVNYMFGVKTIVKKPYRLKTLNGTGFDKRSLTFIEYNPAIYNPPEQLVPLPPTTMPKGVTHVNNLQYAYDLRTTDVNTAVRGVISWNTADSPNYGGADIYVSLNGADYVFSKSVLSTSEAQLDFHLGDTVGIKVVAFNTNQLRAPIGTAPSIMQQIVAGPTYLSPPTGVVVQQVNYLALGLVEATWNAPLASVGDTGIKFRVQALLDGTSEWDEYGVTSETLLRLGDLPVGNHRVRVRTERGESISVWTEGTFGVAKTADSIQPGATVGAPIGTNIGNVPVQDILDQLGDISEGGFSDFNPPAVTTGLALSSAVTDSGATLRATWTASAATDFAGYDVAIRQGAGAWIDTSTSGNVYEWKNLPRGTTFDVRVRAYDRASNKGNWSTVVSLMTAKDAIAPSAAGSFSYDAAFNTISLNWQNAADTDLAYAEVYHNTTDNNASATLLAVVVAEPSTRSQYIHTGLAAGSSHYYWVKLVDTSGNRSGFAASGLVKTAFVQQIDLVAGLSAIGSLATLPNPVGYTGPSVVFNTTDRKLYRYENGAWSAAVKAVDIAGELTKDQIAAGAITTEKLVKNAVTTDKLDAGSVTTEKLVKGSVTKDILGAGSVTTEAIVKGSVSKDAIADAAIDVSKFDNGVSPVQRLAALPAQPYKAGAVVVLTTDNKLYRSTGTAWLSSTSATDVTGQIVNTQIDSRGLNVLNPNGDIVFGSDGYISKIASIDLGGNNVLLSTVAQNSLVPSLNYVGEFKTPPTSAQLGLQWKQNAVYKNSSDMRSYVLTGSPLDWVIYLSDGQSFDVKIESSNGTVFRVGQAKETLLIARLFKNGAEVTAEAPDNWFSWRRVSALPQPAPNDDASWNTKYNRGYKNVQINIDAVHARATFFVDIIN
jgi:predicted phage tail protein